MNNRLFWIGTVLVGILLFQAIGSIGASEVGADGSFDYSIPLDLPPATGAIGPELALTYNSGSGNGLLGVGWNLQGYDCIIRDSRYPVRLQDPYDPRPDHFMFMGQKLIQDPSNTRIYHTESESYLKIEFCSGGNVGYKGNGNYWKVTDKNGVTRFYGSRPTDSLGNGGGFIHAWGFNENGVQTTAMARIWALDKVMDVHGNYYTINYKQYFGSGGHHIQTIIYTRNDDPSKPYGYYRAVRFEYTPGRPDTIGDARPSPVFMEELLTGIKVYTDVRLNSNGDILTALVHHSYKLTYSNDAILDCSRSFLKSFQEFNTDGTISKPPLRFTYTPNHKVRLDDSDNRPKETIYQNSDYNPVLAVEDFNGDGKDDIMFYEREHTVAIYYSSNIDYTQNGGFPDEKKQVINAPFWKDSIDGTRISNLGSVIQFGDFNGDCKKDFMLFVGNISADSTPRIGWQLFLSNSGGFASDRYLWLNFGDIAGANTGTTGFDTKMFRTGDFNGDGKTDLISFSPSTPTFRYRTPWRIFLAKADCTGFDLQVASITYDPYSGYGGSAHCMSFSPELLAMGDFDGDGRNDFIVYTNVGYSSDSFYWVLHKSDGNGSFVRDTNLYSFGNFNTDNLTSLPPEVYFHDFNGDGATDALSHRVGLTAGRYDVDLNESDGRWEIFYANSQYLQYTYPAVFLPRGLNQTTNTFATPKTGRLEPDQFGDFNGDGIIDFMIGARGRKLSAYEYDNYKFRTFYGTGIIGKPFREIMVNNAPVISVLDKVSFNKDYPDYPETNAYWSIAGVFTAGDFDGNGSTDFLYRTGNDKSTIYRLHTSNGNGTFTNPLDHYIDIKYTFEFNDVGDFRIISSGNFSGSGKTEFLVCQSYLNTVRYKYYKQQDTLRADLLATITNGIGGTTTITYLPATSFPAALYATSGEEVVPTNRFAINSCIPDKRLRNLVNTVKIQNGMYPQNGQSEIAGHTQYYYCGGLAYPGKQEDRQALGFTYIIALDKITNYKTKTFYWQDKSSCFAGAVKGVETYDAQNTLITSTLNAYVTRQDNAALPVYFVYKANESYTVYPYSIFGGDPITYQTLFVSYDNYGNCTSVYNKGNTAIDADDTQTEIEFAVNTEKYIMKIYKQSTYGYDQGGNWGLATQTYKYFDDSPNLKAIDKGLVTRIVSKVDSSAPDTVNSFAYDGYGNCTSITDARSNLTQNVYDNAYHMLLVKTIGPAPLNMTKMYTYDAYMNQTVTEDISNGVVEKKVVFNSFNQPWKLFLPDDAENAPAVTMLYDYEEKAINPGDGTSNKKWFHTIIKPVRGTKPIETYTFYNGLDQVIMERSTLPEAIGIFKTIIYRYDNSGRLHQVTVPISDNGNPAVWGNPEHYWNHPCTTTEYDSYGKPSKISHPDGTITWMQQTPTASGVLDPNGHYTETARSGNKQITKEYRGTYRDLTEFTLSSNRVIFGVGTTTVEYRGGTEVIDNKGQKTTTVIDMLGRRTAVTSPDMGAWTFGYDANGNMTRKTDAKNQEIKYVYDNYNRLITIDYPSGTDTTLTYDEPNHGYSKGRLTTAAYAAGSISYTYNKLGKIEEQTVTIDGIGRTEKFTYYPTGQLATQTMPDNEVITYDYYENGLLKSVKGANDYISSTSYNLRGQMTSVLKGNASLTNYDYYDTAGEDDYYGPYTYRLKSESTLVKQDNGQSFYHNYRYYYDKKGNLKTKLYDADIRKTASYAYDELDRLTDITGAPPIGNVNYIYNELGSMDRRSGVDYTYDPVTKNIIEAKNYSFDYFYYYPDTNRLKYDGRFWYHYDANGNLLARTASQNYVPAKIRIGTSDYTTLQEAHNAAKYGDIIKATAATFTGDITPALTSAYNVTFSGGWDADFNNNTNAGFSVLAGQIKNNYKNVNFDKFVLAGEDPGLIYYTYDYNNMLVSAGRSTYAYFGERRVKKTENGITTRYFFSDYEEESGASTNILKKYAGGANRSTRDGLLFVYKEITGNPSIITNQGGYLVSSSIYEPYGAKVIEEGSPTFKYKFAGGERDGTGLSYFGARYYDPRICRFITPDTIVPGSSPQNMNRYSYCMNNPVNYIDPSGHEGQVTESMEPGHWFFEASDDVYKYSGLEYIFSAADYITKPVLKFMLQPLDEMGIDEIHFGIWKGIGAEVSINCETGDYSCNVGTGAGIKAGVTTKYGNIGGACETHAGLGYNSADKSVYFKTNVSGGLGGTASAGVMLGYSFKNHVAYQDVNLSMGPLRLGWSSYGSVSNTYVGMGFGGLSASWSSKSGFGLGFSLMYGGNSAGVTYNVNNGKWQGSVGIDMCFVAGTKIQTADGLKNIEEIRAGDMVMSYDDKTGEFGYKEVVRTIVTRPDKIVKVTVGDELLECTTVHPFFVVHGSESGMKTEGSSPMADRANGTWVEACDLEPGMMLLSSGGSLVEITQIETVNRNETTYNFEVADWHTYCVGEQNVVVHNDSTKCRDDWKKCLKEAVKDGADAAHSYYNSARTGRLKSGIAGLDAGMQLGQIIVGIIDAVTTPHYINPEDLGLPPAPIPPAPGRPVYPPSAPDLYSGVEELPLVGRDVPGTWDDLDPE